MVCMHAFMCKIFFGSLHMKSVIIVSFRERIWILEDVYITYCKKK